MKYLIFSFVIIFSMGLSLLKSKDESKPNIIWIVADDAGYADFGFMGSEEILTPNLDLLAKEGVVFTQNYVSASVCSPSRAGMLTGLYQQRFGHECNLEPDQPLAFDQNQITIAEALKLQGYNTSIFGKWHLGVEKHQHPLANGFDYFWGFLAGGRSYFPDSSVDKKGHPRAILENYKLVKPSGYLTDQIGQQAVKYINDQANESGPFYMYLAFNAPHTPMEAKPEDLAKFSGPRQTYAAMMWSMDEAIGHVLNELKATGQDQNTLIFFISDNGGAHNNQSSVFPLKGWKGNQYEGGIRVPMIVKWSNKIPQNKKYTGMSSSLDMYATSVTAAGIDKKDLINLDGKNIFPYLTQSTFNLNVHDTLFWRKDQMATIRMNDLKLINLNQGQSVIYDLNESIEENSDHWNDISELDKMALKKGLLEWEKKLQNPIWIEPENWNEVTYGIYEGLMNNRAVIAKDPGQLKSINN